MQINHLLLFLNALLFSAIFINLLLKLRLVNKVMSPKGIPLIGGMGLALAFFASYLLGPYIMEVFPKDGKGILIASLIILFFGFIDDLRELPVLGKLIVQLASAATLIFFGVRTHIVFLNEPLNILVSVIWIIGIVNAFNLLDVMDGVTASCAIFASISFFLISFINADIPTAILSIILAGACFGFLIFNFPPAKVYLGNCGSHFIGLLLAAIALTISYAPMERKIALLSPIVILGLPILDTLFLIFIRFRKGRLPFNKSNDHIALRLLKSGYSKKRALNTMVLICIFYSLSGISLSLVSNLTGIVILLLVFFTSLIIVKRMKKIAVDE